MSPPSKLMSQISTNTTQTINLQNVLRQNLILKKINGSTNFYVYHMIYWLIGLLSNLTLSDRVYSHFTILFLLLPPPFCRGLDPCLFSFSLYRYIYIYKKGHSFFFLDSLDSVSHVKMQGESQFLKTRVNLI